MLELYILENCPYCQKVIKVLDENNMHYKKIDIANEDNKETLIRFGGKRQVPFLIDKERNVQMYESEDIINYLKTIC